MERNGMNSPSLIDLQHRLAQDSGLAAALASVDQHVNKHCSFMMAQIFPEIFRAEDKGQLETMAALKDLFFGYARLSMRQIDESGVTAAIGQIAKHLRDFSFERNAVSLSYDYAYLTETLRIPDEKVRPFWRFLDGHRDEILDLFSRPGFRLESLVEPANKRFDDSDGEEWEHLSPGIWRRLAGFALGCANVGLAAGTAGVGIPVAAASVIAGAAAVAVD